MHVRNPRLGLALAVALLGGCGVGGIAAASGGGGGGGGDSKRPPPPPMSTLTIPSGAPRSNLITLEYRLEDARVRDGTAENPGGDEDPRVRTRPQWQFAEDDPTDETAWRDMTEANLPGTDGTRGLPLGSHSFLWNTILDFGAVNRRVRARVLAEYEETSGLTRRFRWNAGVFEIDNRLATTLLGEQVQPVPDLDFFPIAVQSVADGILVGCFGSNIVERVDPNGLVRRFLGYGIPGNNIQNPTSGVVTPRHPGIARLPVLLAFAADLGGNLFTNHGNAVFATNRGLAPLAFGSLVVDPQTTTSATLPAGGATPSAPLGSIGASARGMRVHPTGVLLFATNDIANGGRLEAFNLAPPGGPPADVVLAGVTIPAGQRRVLAGSTLSTSPPDQTDTAASAAEFAAIVDLAVGPAGEVYVLERNGQGGGRVRVLNTTGGTLTLGTVSVGAARVATVAGTGTTTAAPGFAGDAGPASGAAFNLPSSIDVHPDGHVFVADAGNLRIRMVNLSGADVTYAGTTVANGDVDTIVGGAPEGPVGGRARDVRLNRPNAVAVDNTGNLLVCDSFQVVFVNGGTATITRYGVTTQSSRTAVVYDAQRRFGLPLSEPLAAHAQSDTTVWFTDRSTVRALNLSTQTRVFGGDAALPGDFALVGGGPVEGFSGDGGSARSATFAQPNAVASDGPLRLFVADTLNDRIRFIATGDPLVPGDTQAVLGQTVAPGNVTTVVGGVLGAIPNDGDGLAATAASLRRPEGVAVGPDGLLWVSDTQHHRVRVVNTLSSDVTVAGVTIAPGTIRTVIGTGVPGDSPDGAGPWAIQEPTSLVLDNRGLVYVALRGNARIRVLNTSAATVTLAGVTVAPGEFRTLVGTGVPGNFGDGALGTEAQIISARSLFLHLDASSVPDALFFADESAHVVRVLNLSETNDIGLTYDHDPSLVGGELRIRSSVPARGMATIAGGPNILGNPNGPAFQGDGAEARDVRFNRPIGVALVSRNGRTSDMFVADSGNRRIRRFAAPPLVVTATE